VSSDRSQAEAFAELAMPLFDSLFNFARWLTRNKEEAEDLVQETYVKALRGFESFQTGTNFKAWMFRILRNTFLTSRTGLAAQKTVYLEEEEGVSGDVQAMSTTQTPETILLDRVNEETMQRAIAELPTALKEVLLLCEVEEMSYQEMSEALSIPMGTVMSRLSRARATLRKALLGKAREANAM
jgi:RNA polymerase sigma-70 factor, ECF subfamily